MTTKIIAIRPFVGAKDFDVSRDFYLYLGFSEISLDLKLSLFQNGNIGFYLQDAFVKEWLDNTMLFFEVEDLEQSYHHLNNLNFTDKFPGTRLSKIVQNDWGRECFVHDPSGILLHFGEFHKR